MPLEVISSTSAVLGAVELLQPAGDVAHQVPEAGAAVVDERAALGEQHLGRDRGRAGGQDDLGPVHGADHSSTVSGEAGRGSERVGRSSLAGVLRSPGRATSRSSDGTIPQPRRAARNRSVRIIVRALPRAPLPTDGDPSVPAQAVRGPASAGPGRHRHAGVHGGRARRGPDLRGRRARSDPVLLARRRRASRSRTRGAGVFGGGDFDWAAADEVDQRRASRRVPADRSSCRRASGHGAARRSRRPRCRCSSGRAAPSIWSSRASLPAPARSRSRRHGGHARPEIGDTVDDRRPER